MPLSFLIDSPCNSYSMGLMHESIRFIDSLSDGFIYMVSSASVTGSQSGFGSIQEDYFKRVAGMNLKNL